MQINRITNACTDAAKKVGRTIIESKNNPGAKGNILRKINGLVQGEGYNPGRPAYYFLMSGCVIAPRLLQAREPDEFREILTRDVVTVVTILFAMKGLKSGMCSMAQKKGGFALVKDTVGKDASIGKKILGYLNPEGGIAALDSSEIIARYSNIKDKESLVKTLNMVDKEGGNIAKMFSIEKEQQKGFAKILNKLPFGKKDNSTPLYDAAVKMFGGNFKDKSNAELINTIQNIQKTDSTALEGLEEIIGSSSFGKKAGEEVKKGILNGKNNPITNYARNINANFETISLAITAGFLGFGLPKINEKMTMKKHLQGPNKNAINERRQQTAQSAQNPPLQGTGASSGLVYKTIKSKKSDNPFKGFIA